MASKRRVLAVTAALALLAGVVSLCVGAVTVPPGELLAALAGRGEGTGAAIVLYVRLPRTAGCLAAGACLAVAGAVIQTVLANPLASPSVIGVNAGAGAAVALCCALAPMAVGQALSRQRRGPPGRRPASADDGRLGEGVRRAEGDVDRAECGQPCP